jgi:hypothetical protein
MYKHFVLALAATAFSTGAFAQSLDNVNTTPSDYFQISYAANLNIGDSFVNITNSGATAPVTLCAANDAVCLADPPVTASLNLCANIYTFDPQEELISCCSCSVTPNGLQSLSVVGSLISNPLTPAIPTAVVTKIVGTVQLGTVCNAATPGIPGHGLLAWGTTLHQNTSTAASSYSVTETPFSQAALTLAEYAHVVSFCGFIQADGSGFGICKGCAGGGLGATSTQ